MINWLQKTRATLLAVCATGIPVALWCLLIFTLSSVPGDRYPQIRWEHADKFVHVNLYAMLGFLACGYFRPRNLNYILIGMLGVLYGLSDEIHQLWVPNRTYSMSDLLADTCGIILGLTVFAILNNSIHWTKSNTAHNSNEPSERMEIT